MNLQEYFEFTETTKSYPNLVEYDYLTHGVWGEIGEFESILAKKLRGDEKYKDHEVYINSLKSELGDILWFLVRIFYHNNALELTPLPNPICYNNISQQISIFKKNLNEYTLDLSLISFQKLCYLLETTIEEVMELNIKKLTERKNTNTIKGDGETVNERFSLGK